VYQSAKNDTPIGKINFKDFLDGIKNGRWEDRVEHLRSLSPE
jgi:hypothetical protein